MIWEIQASTLTNYVGRSLIGDADDGNSLGNVVNISSPAGVGDLPRSVDVLPPPPLPVSLSARRPLSQSWLVGEPPKPDSRRLGGSHWMRILYSVGNIVEISGLCVVKVGSSFRETMGAIE
ncbi:unnamed protein product [Notodromas monacha]|uniref:Uncharacterized protein n=1 Tax=Notodromas monacha TaxID=399045 RepID=A0A7R9GAK3_9CRUS|nr:unnamed protein product [Notodromas monacha]CAG0914090.1 unnamed protein product [Notodromas monacha]